MTHFLDSSLVNLGLLDVQTSFLIRNEDYDSNLSEWLGSTLDLSNGATNIAAGQVLTVQGGTTLLHQDRRQEAWSSTRRPEVLQVCTWAFR